MSKFKSLLIKGIDDPITTILVAVAIAVGVIAIYIGGPWYIGGPTTAIGAAIEDDLVRFFTGVFYLVPSVMTLRGVHKHNQRLIYRGSFGLSLALMFMVILRLVTFGFSPAIWVFQLALSFIAGVIYLAVRDEK